MKHFGFNAAWGYDCTDNYERLKRCEQLSAEKGVTVAQIALAAEIELTDAERRWLNLQKQR